MSLKIQPGQRFADLRSVVVLCGFVYQCRSTTPLDHCGSTGPSNDG